jgi:hypothetical protein
LATAQQTKPKRQQPQQVQRKKVAIIGTAPASRMEAPWQDESWEIWGLSHDAKLPRVTRWYELHNIERKLRKDADYWGWLQQEHDFPIYLTKTDDRIPSGRQFPFDAIRDKYRTYFCSQVDLMIAHALLEDAAEVRLYGIDMAQNSEYAHQRKSAEYWLGFCEGHGVKIEVPATSPLLKSRGVYGIDDAVDEFAALFAARDKELNEKLAAKQAEAQQASAIAMQLSGAITELERLSAASVDAADQRMQHMFGPRINELRQQAEHAVRAKNQAENDVHVLLGAQENMRWARQGW